MTDPVTVVIPGNPIGKARPRFTKKGVAYTPRKTRVYEHDIAVLAKAEMGSHPLMLGPVQMTFRAVFAIPESWSARKKQDALLGRIRPTGRPDTDNLMKAIADGLNGIVYHDDAQVVEVNGSKRYGERPMMVVTVTPILGAFTDATSQEEVNEHEAA